MRSSRFVAKATPPEYFCRARLVPPIRAAARSSEKEVVMRTAIVATAIAGAAALASVAFAAASPEGSGRPITVEMTGAAERPGPGDPDGSGTAAFRINPGQG